MTTVTSTQAPNGTETDLTTPGEPTMPTTEPTATMRAIVQERYGSDASEVLRLGDAPTPEAGSGQVLVRVHAAGVDRGTWHLMTGLPYAVRPVSGLRRPRNPVPGLDLAGTVVAVGEGVSAFAPGDEVFGTGHGSFAEYTVAEVGKLAPKPPSLSFEQAAAVPVSAQTALQAVRDHGKVEAGQRVLVLGASGGVGSYVVQIAKAFGAEVTGVASTAKLDLVRGLGADHVIDYTAEDATDGSVRYDVIIDIGGNTRLAHLRRALTPEGRLVIVGGETDGRWLGGVDRQIRATVLSLFVGQSLGMFLSKENTADLEALTELVEDGKLTPAVGQTYALADAAEAVDALAAGRVRGKAVVSI